MKWLLGILLVLLFLAPVSADEEVTVEYIMERTYWHGKGELIADNLSKKFVLHTNGNTIVSYATDARIVNVNDDSIEFKSNDSKNELHVLFLTSKPSELGLWSIELMPPSVTGEQDIKVKIEMDDICRIVYLNGPLLYEGLYEGGNIYQEGQNKVIEVDSNDKVSIIYLTGFLRAMGASVFILFLLGFVFFRRRTISEKINKNLEALRQQLKTDFGGVFSLRESSKDIEINFNPSDYIGKREGRIFLRLPKAVVAALFIILLLVFAVISLGSALIDFLATASTVSLIYLGIYLVVALLIGILFLAVNTATDFFKTISILVGGGVLIKFSYLGILALPFAVVSAIVVYQLTKIFFVQHGSR